MTEAEEIFFRGNSFSGSIVDCSQISGSMRYKFVTSNCFQSVFISYTRNQFITAVVSLCIILDLQEQHNWGILLHLILIQDVRKNILLEILRNISIRYFRTSLEEQMVLSGSNGPIWSESYPNCYGKLEGMFIQLTVPPHSNFCPGGG